VVIQVGDDSEHETWVAKPALTAQELATAASATPPSVQVAQAMARPSTFPLAGLPPTRMTSPLPPPPRRSHPAPGLPPTPSTAPQAFSQSSAAQMPPFSSRDGLPPPSMPPLIPSQAPLSASPNGAAEGDLPAFPLDEIDPDDERPFRPSQGPGAATTPSGDPATADAQYQPSDGSLRGVLAYIRANPRDPKLLVALSGGAILVVGLLWAFAGMSGAKSKESDETAKAASSAADPASSANAASAAAAVAASAKAAQESAKAAATACRLAGAPARLAEKASKDIPLELLVASSGERVRLGFATSINAAHGVSVDLSSLRVTPEFAKPPRDRLRAVIPLGMEDAPEFVAQLEGHADKLKAWRTISVEPHLVIGWSGSALGMADKASHAPTTLWALEGTDPIDVIRAVRTEDRGHAVVFRRHGAIYGGMIGPDRAPVGELTRIAGAGSPPGSPIGTPTVAVNGPAVAVAFADRASSDEPWGIRVGTAPVGSFPATTSPFVIPPGGPGGATLAPALSGLPDGRWLLVWTEGSGGAHDVRGVTLGADLAPVGPALTVSREGSNAGQGAVALRAGRGLVAYLALTEEGYEVWGTSVDCR
jgi:hypothetical protein